ncbi:MAG: hypothetical protein E7159_02175 [Firmicutes bacterium]|nr:hypothetical protein [Bacillota bacterium]
MYTYPSSSLVRSATTASASNSSVVAIVALICAIVGSILVFVLFLRKDNESKYTGFVKWLYDYLQFNKLTIDIILRFTYLFLAIFITVASFGLISTSFLGFLLSLILGNLVLRVVYEFSMLVILIYRNVRELNEKTKK